MASKIFELHLRSLDSKPTVGKQPVADINFLSFVLNFHKFQVLTLETFFKFQDLTL